MRLDTNGKQGIQRGYHAQRTYHDEELAAGSAAGLYAKAFEAHFCYSPSRYRTVIGDIEALRCGVSVSLLFLFAVTPYKTSKSNLAIWRRCRIKSYPQRSHAFSPLRSFSCLHFFYAGPVDSKSSFAFSASTWLSLG